MIGLLAEILGLPKPFRLRSEHIYALIALFNLLVFVLGWLLGALLTAMPFVFGLTACFSLVSWRSALQGLRLVRDTPTSTIASAAQGYVELVGTGRPMWDRPMASKLSGTPCVWYRYKVEAWDQDSNGWYTDDQGESERPFLLEDRTGSCVVKPEGAKILTDKHTWQTGDRRYTEWVLPSNETLYAIGQFRTHEGAPMLNTLNDEVRDVFNEWKKDMPEMQKRFDLDGNGQLDEKEWMLARRAAKREADRRFAEKQKRASQSATSYLEKPEDGRSFMLSNTPQTGLEQEYQFWVWAHLGVFFTSLAGLGVMLGHHVVFGA